MMYPGLLRTGPSLPPPTTDLAELATDDVVARIRQGDSRAFEALYLAFYPPLCAFVATIIGNAAQSEDIVQDLLYPDLGTPDLVAADERWRARRYLFGAARNRALNHLKRQRVEARAAELTPRHWTTHGPTPHSDAEAADFSSALARAARRVGAAPQVSSSVRMPAVAVWPDLPRNRRGHAHHAERPSRALLTRGLKALRGALIAFDM